MEGINWIVWTGTLSRQNSTPAHRLLRSDRTNPLPFGKNVERPGLQPEVLLFFRWRVYKAFGGVWTALRPTAEQREGSVSAALILAKIS